MRSLICNPQYLREKEKYIENTFNTLIILYSIQKARKIFQNRRMDFLNKLNDSKYNVLPILPIFLL